MKMKTRISKNSIQIYRCFRQAENNYTLLCLQQVDLPTSCRFFLYTVLFPLNLFTYLLNCNWEETIIVFVKGFSAKYKG